MIKLEFQIFFVQFIDFFLQKLNELFFHCLEFILVTVKLFFF